MNLTQQYFKLYASCIVVSGVIRSTICDLQKGKIHLVSNDSRILLNRLKNKPVDSVIQHYNYDSSSVLQELERLKQLELGYWHDDPKKFPDMDLHWESPEMITNAIIEIGENVQMTIDQVLPQVLELGCKQIEFRILEYVCIKDILRIVKVFDESKVRGIILIQKFKGIDQAKEYIDILEKFPRVIQVGLHSFEESNYGKIENFGLQAGGRLLITPEHLNNSHCGFISVNKFVTNVDSFTEAVNYNSCLNKKLTVDANGNILNCPAMKTIHGNVKTHSVQNIINTENFQSVWKISKNQIDTCKSCEFRFVCSDCRAFVENPGNIYSKPLKCGYDPSSGIWQSWSENPLKKDAIAMYELTETVEL